MKDCQYVPHVTTVQVGQPVIFHNEDRTLHNVHLIPLENPEKGVGQPGNGIKQEFKLRKPEVGIYVKCGVHAWMFCIVHVMAHPHYDITREAGTFEIADVPPGEYELTAWQEFKLFKLDEEKLRVRVVPGEVTEVTFTFRPKQGEQQDR